MFATLLLAAEEVSVKAKNPILPEADEILWAGIAFTEALALFGFVLFFLAKS